MGSFNGWVGFLDVNFAHSNFLYMIKCYSLNHPLCSLLSSESHDLLPLPCLFCLLRGLPITWSCLKDPEKTRVMTYPRRIDFLGGFSSSSSISHEISPPAYHWPGSKSLVVKLQR